MATQPDMVLAWEKDGFYAKQIHGQLKVRLRAVPCISYTPIRCRPDNPTIDQRYQRLVQEVAEALLGARWVELLGPEVEALGDLLYYGLTVLGGAFGGSIDRSIGPCLA